MLCQQGQKLILLVNKASSARLSAVIKTPENKMFQAFGRFETLGSNLRYGIPKEVATVLYPSRKVTIASTSKRAGQKSVISKKFDFVVPPPHS